MILRLLALWPSLLCFFVFETLITRLSGDEQYQDGYYDQPHLATNLPFTSDTSRLSDGRTSSSPFNSNSPSFEEPNYKPGYYVANTTDRYLYDIAYRTNAALQGLGTTDDGDEGREVARLAVFEENRQDDLAPSTYFTVFASLKWNPTGWAVQEGETYNLQVQGDQMWYDGGFLVNSKGYKCLYDARSDCNVCFGRCKTSASKNRRLADANWMSLVCSIGQFVSLLYDVEPGAERTSYYMPIDESQVQSTMFDVGTGTDFRASTTGQLICFANDAHTLYWNNKGEINVTVTRASWPPTNESYYAPLKLPSCDSAIVVYSLYTSKPLECNPNGGGAGWVAENIPVSNENIYGGGIPDYLKYDLQDLAN